MLIEEKFEQYTVYHDNEDYHFVYIKIDDSEDFFDSFAKYILDFEKLKVFTQTNIAIKKDLDIQDYNNIYTSLYNFVDYERLFTCNLVDQYITKILKEEYLADDNPDLRKDKWGRIGEYVFNMILDSYFKFDCIIRKFALNTSHNVSVFGIDTIHYSHENSMFYFGESKMVSSLENGISLLNESLKEYEARISEEYFTVLKNRNFRLNETFETYYRDYMNKCVSFQELINTLDIKNIGIPLFISHSDNLNNNEIFEKLNRVKKISLFNLNTIYYVISHPIFDKEKFREAFINQIQIKIKECEECIHRI